VVAELVPTHIFAFTAATIFVIALYYVVTHPNFMKKIIAINILGSAVFLYIVSFAYHSDPLDHVAHAIVLTGIVVAVAGSALALRIHQRLTAPTNSDEQDES